MEFTFKVQHRSTFLFLWFLCPAFIFMRCFRLIFLLPT